ncbi:MAG: helix-turn-helix transcriptional regulator [Spirochaetales bacterium]|nr:helix-turn-helix transcriptional regulator [Spirochaetales bacterium]
MVDLMLLDTEARVKAFTHPYRMKLVHVFRETRRAMTATEVARVLGDGPGRVHYHMRVLEAAGIVKVARTETVNGILARYYEPTAKHYSVADAMSGPGCDGTRGEVARMISRRFRDGLRAFLERTTEAPGQDDEAFLFEYVIHCDNDDWSAFRTRIDDAIATYAEPAPGTRPRRLFIAGATDRLVDNPGEAGSPVKRNHSESPSWPPYPQPER